LSSGESCFCPRIVSMMNWKSVSEAMVRVRCRDIHLVTSGFAVLIQESKNEIEIIKTLCEKETLLNLLEIQFDTRQTATVNLLILR
jgi:hypothetical protein